jgi:hypothetical protein
MIQILSYGEDAYTLWELRNRLNHNIKSLDDLPRLSETTTLKIQ